MASKLERLQFFGRPVSRQQAGVSFPICYERCPALRQLYRTLRPLIWRASRAIYCLQQGLYADLSQRIFIGTHLTPDDTARILDMTRHDSILNWIQGLLYLDWARFDKESAHVAHCVAALLDRCPYLRRVDLRREKCPRTHSYAPFALAAVRSLPSRFLRAKFRIGIHRRERSKRRRRMRPRCGSWR